MKKFIKIEVYSFIFQGSVKRITSHHPEIINIDIIDLVIPLAHNVEGLLNQKNRIFTTIYLKGDYKVVLTDYPIEDLYALLEPDDISITKEEEL